MSIFVFRSSLRAWMLLFNTDPWISESSANIRSKIFRVTSFVELKRMFEVSSSLSPKLSVNHLAANYSAKHRWIKCGFPSILSIIIPNCWALALRRNFFACYKSLAFITHKSPLNSFRDPWISESFANVRSKIFRVTSFFVSKRMFETKSSRFLKLSINHLAAKYSAKHRWIKCGFPFASSLNSEIYCLTNFQGLHRLFHVADILFSMDPI